MVDTNLVYDIGMNNGDDTAYYLSLGYNVVAVEAAPNLVELAYLRFKDYVAAKRLFILNIGIAEIEGSMPFYINKFDSGWSSFDLNLGTRGGAGYDAVNIATQTLNRIIKSYGVPYYMKIDIEGYDGIALKSLFKCVKKPAFISIELFSIEQIDWLSQLGYTQFKIIDQQNFLSLEIPLTNEYRTYQNFCKFNTSKNIFIGLVRKLFGKYLNGFLERRYKHLFKYNHKLGSSGPFGKDVPGRWNSLPEIKHLFLFYQKKFQDSKVNQQNGWWIDIHATY